MSKIAILYPYEHMKAMEKDDAIKAFLSGPDNIGNKIYLDVLKEVFPDAELIAPETLVNSPVFVRDTYQKILFPMSNMLSPYYKSPLAEIVEKYDMDIVLISIGVQAPLNTDINNLPISHDALSLIRSSYGKGNIIGARGDHTFSILNNYGIESKIIGCPSLLAIDKIRSPDPDNICVNATLSGHHRSETAEIMAFAVGRAKGYALQDEARIIRDVFRINLEEINFSEEHSLYVRDLENKLFDYGYYNNGKYHWGDVRDFFLKNAFFHIEVKNWIDDLAKFGLSVGMRMHGNVAALMSGTPAIFVPCDLRTQELISYHDLPHMDRIDESTSQKDIIDCAQYGKFHEKQRGKRKDFMEFSERVGLSDYVSKLIFN